MASEGVDRRLAAIPSADVVGYSRLMAEDEDATVSRITAYREEIELLVYQHRGRLVAFHGDECLAEFGSAVAAVQCADEIQRTVSARNARAVARFWRRAPLGAKKRAWRPRSLQSPFGALPEKRSSAMHTAGNGRGTRPTGPAIASTATRGAAPIESS